MDKELEEVFTRELEYWRRVFKRTITLVRFLAEGGLDFRGAGGHETLGDPRSGNFLNLIEKVSTFDPILSEHVKRIKNKEIADHYLSKTIQNEIITMIAKETREEILRIIKKAKYYFIIVDCTPDVSHKEQLFAVYKSMVKMLVLTNSFLVSQIFIVRMLKAIKKLC